MSRESATLAAGAMGAAAPEEDERQLASRIAAGDAAAFERLMRRHNRRLFRLARATLRDPVEAEDALQEAYLSAYRSMAQFRGDAGLATWLARLVLNECLGRRRRQARRDNIIPMTTTPDERDFDAMPMGAGFASPEKELMRSELRSLLERELDSLPEAFRVVFVLRCVEELSVEETAACLNIPEATVRTRLFRARSLLREALTRDLAQVERQVYEFGGRHCDRVVAQVLARLAREAE